MATTWIKLNVAALGYAANTTIAIDDKRPELAHLLNAGLATRVANPGGTPPVFATVVPVDNADRAISQYLSTAGSATAAAASRVGAVTGAGTPGVANGAQATGTPTVVGADTAGTITATALASGMAAGVIATVTFGTPFTATPKAVLLDERSAAAVGLYVSAKSATGFTLSSRSAATASQALVAEYAVIA